MPLKTNRPVGRSTNRPIDFNQSSQGMQTFPQPTHKKKERALDRYIFLRGAPIAGTTSLSGFDIVTDPKD
jgi:hypothetical protein